jgi:hypothetical protein
MGCGTSQASPVAAESSGPDPSSFLARVQRAMKAADWTFSVEFEKKRIFAVVGDQQLTFVMRILLYEDKDVVLAQITLERACPEQARRALAVWSNMKNWTLKFGFFYCDPRDGEISFRDSMSYQHVKVTPKAIDNLLRRTINPICNSYLEILRIVNACG